MLIATAGLLVAGTLIGLVDSRLELPAATERTAGRVGIALSAVAVIAGIVIGLAAVGNPGDWLDDRWRDFKGTYDEGFQTSRFTGDLGSGRYDFWSVGLSDEFASAPIVGEGADNFAVGYLEHRDTDEEPFYPHSLPVRSSPGPGSSARFSPASSWRPPSRSSGRGSAPDPLGRGVAAVSARRRRLLPPPQRRRLALDLRRDNDARDGLARDRRRRHGPRAGSPDGAAAARPGANRPAGGGGRRRDRRRRLPGAALDLRPAHRQRRVRLAGRSEEAYSRLDTARDLNPLSARPDLVAGTIAIRNDDPARAAAAFARAAEREPTNWYARLELGTLDLADGDRARGSPSCDARAS